MAVVGPDNGMERRTEGRGNDERNYCRIKTVFPGGNPAMIARATPGGIKMTAPVIRAMMSARAAAAHHR